MSGKLYKLGKWTFAHKWRVLAVWVVALIGLTFWAVDVHKPLSTAITIPGTKAQLALDKLSKELPAASKGSGTVVFAAPKGHTLTDDKTAIEQTVAAIAKVQGVTSAVSPFVSQTVSEDKQIAFTSIQLSSTSQEVPDSVKNAISTIVEDARSQDLQVELRGDITTSIPDTGSTEGLGVAIAAVVLIITFASLVAAGMPLIIAFTAVGMGMIGVQVASGFMSLPSTATALSTMLGLAVGIDYSLFLIVRYIKYLREGATPAEAVGRAVATAGNAVIFAALTVVIALSALSVVGIPFLAAMGIFAALTVAFAALAAITLIPALLGLARFKVLPKKARKLAAERIATDADRISHRSIAYKWVSFITKRPALIILAAVIGLGALALPATKLYLGLPSDATAAKTSTERKAYDLLSEGFGPGFNGPLLVVADLPGGLSQAEQQAKLISIASSLKKDTGVALATPAGVSPNGKVGILQVYPTTGPDATETRDLIGRLRTDATQIAGENTTISITGATAVAVDTNDKLSKALPVYLLVVVGLSLLILLTVFRSIVVPIKATLGFILTILATLGLMVMFFQWGWLGIVEAGPILSFLPILATGILFGLAMDYEFFLVSGMQEEYHKNKDAKQAVVRGFTHGAKVVTVAAIIMMAVFAGFIFTNDPIIKSIGFALAAGVFIDAFIVRMTIVPAVMKLFGAAAWWFPKWLDRLLPNISIEGATQQQLEAHEDLDNMRRAALMLSFGDDMAKIQRIIRLDKEDSGELSLVLDNVLLTVGLESKVTAATLAKLHTITPVTAAKYLDALEEHGYVSYEAHASGQSHYARLTRKGADTYDRLLRQKLKGMNVFLKPLSDEDIRVLAKIVRKLRVSNQ